MSTDTKKSFHLPMPRISGGLQKASGLPSLRQPPLSQKDQEILSEIRAQNTSIQARKDASVLAEVKRMQMVAKVQEIKKSITLNVAVCLDFTASTSHVVDSFKTEARSLVSLLKRDGNVANLLPIAFHGPGSNASAGKTNDLTWWNGRENISNGRGEPPIVAGLSMIKNASFFSESSSSAMNFVVIGTDEALLKDTGYAEVLHHLKQTQATVIAIVSDNSDRIVQSFSGMLSSDLPGKVVTISNVEGAANIAADVIKNIRDIYIENTVETNIGMFDKNSVKVNLPPIDFTSLSKKLGNQGHTKIQLSGNGKNIPLLK